MLLEEAKAAYVLPKVNIYCKIYALIYRHAGRREKHTHINIYWQLLIGKSIKIVVNFVKLPDTCNTKLVARRR